MSPNNKWIVLKTKNQQNGDFIDSPYNVKFILYAKKWYHKDGVEDDKSIKLYTLNRSAPIRAFGLSLDMLAKLPDFLSLNAITEHSDEDIHNNTRYPVVINKNNISDYRPYDDKNKKSAEKKFALYLMSQGDAMPKHFITTDDLPLLFPESVSGY